LQEACRVGDRRHAQQLHDSGVNIRADHDNAFQKASEGARGPCHHGPSRQTGWPSTTGCGSARPTRRLGVQHHDQLRKTWHPAGYSGRDEQEMRRTRMQNQPQLRHSWVQGAFHGTVFRM
jgi:hypothetical protein